MSYLFIVIIGAIVGFIAGKYIKGSEHGPGVDMVAGAVGGVLAVAISRAASQAATGYVMSVIVTIVGGFAALYFTRMFLRSKQAPVKIKAKRY